MFGKKIDFLAIGDITTDAFIRIKDASVTCDANNEHCSLCMRYADKIPYESVEIIRAVGNAPNAAVSAARLGLSAGLVSNLGSDQNGKECLERLREEKINRKLITVHKRKATNYHYVLWYEADRTILIKHEEYPYSLPAIVAPRWIYLSSLGNTTLPYHDKLSDYLEKNPDVMLAFQPGTFQLHLGAKRLERLYRRSEVFVCNKEEAQKILLNQSEDFKTLLSGIASLGPALTLITDGPKGAYFHDRKNFYFMPPYPDPKPPYERTGAGDAFASTFVSALALRKTPLEALLWAPTNSMSVVQQVGAQKGLLRENEIRDLIKRAPENFKPQIL